MMLSVTIDQSEGISGADIPEQAVKKNAYRLRRPVSPQPPRVFRISFYWTTFHYHLGAENRLLGAMPIKPVNVVWLLYVEKVSLCRTKEEGVWHLISVPSIITLVWGTYPRKTWALLYLLPLCLAKCCGDRILSTENWSRINKFC